MPKGMIIPVDRRPMLSQRPLPPQIVSDYADRVPFPVIVELAAPVPGSDPGTIGVVVQAIEDLNRAEQLARYGNDDQVEPAATMLANFEPTPDRQRIWLLALAASAPLPMGRHGLPLLGPDAEFAPDALLGAALLLVPLNENLDQLSDISVEVRADARRSGVGRALSQAIDAVAVGLGRRTLQGWSDAEPTDDPAGLRPTEGDARIARDERVQFAVAMGYELAQVDWHSVQDLVGQTFPAPQPPAGYRIETWQGATPTQQLAACAELQSRMSTDAPLGDFEAEAEVWDAERYRIVEARMLRTMERITSLAIHQASGAPAGYTILVRFQGRPAPVEQWNTLVAREHRGHGLGIALKQANLARLGDWWPDAERIHTWNAAENAAMWSINERLGYRVANLGAGWQKRL